MTTMEQAQGTDTHDHDDGALPPAGTRMEQVVPAPVMALLGVFDGELKGVAFPGVDREVLQEAAQLVVTRSDEVTRLEAALADARRAMQEAQDGLMQKAQRALSYARIYAEENPELSVRLDAVGNIRAPRKGGRTEVPSPAASASSVAETDPGPGAEKKRRGRPKASGLLFSEENAAAESGAQA